MDNRKIIHIDMDAFFASVEQLDFPEYRGKPLAVGGNAQRGVIAAASYEARKFGVKSAMSSKIAAQLCPDLIFAKPRFSRYQEISKEIRKIFLRYTDKIEPLSLDEAFLDVTENKVNSNSATMIALAIKNDIKNELNLIASAGISYNKFLAKIASDQDKPNGLFVIRPKDAQEFIFQLPIHRFFGIGKVTADKMLELGIPNGKQLYKKSIDFLKTHFKNSAHYYYNIARGIDNRPVESFRERKSIAVEHTYFDEISDQYTLRNELEKLVESLWLRYNKNNNRAKTITLKLKYNDFSLQTKSFTPRYLFVSKKQLYAEAEKLIDVVLPLKMPLRLIGLQLSGFQTETLPLTKEEQGEFDF